MDVWEANSVSAAVTPHSCDTVTQTMCTGDACGGTYSTTRYAGTNIYLFCRILSYVDTNQALVILMDAISTLTEWVIPPSTVRV
jgi:hypothetical protein